jgi:hypothetical protein
VKSRHVDGKIDNFFLQCTRTHQRRDVFAKYYTGFRSSVSWSTLEQCTRKFEDGDLPIKNATLIFEIVHRTPLR